MMYNFLLGLVKERGIVNYIINLKTEMEYLEYSESGKDWDNICKNKVISIYFVDEYPEKIRWKSLSSNRKMDLTIAREFPEKVNWDLLSKRGNLPERFIKRNIQYLNLKNLSNSQVLSEEFLLSFYYCFKKHIPMIMKKHPYNFSTDFEEKCKDQEELSIFVNRKSLSKKRPKKSNKEIPLWFF
jgi:hypothetical protein